MKTLYSVDDCDNFTKILGLGLGIHSAYFSTSLAMELHEIIRIGMMCFYLSLLIAIVAETRQSLRCIDAVQEFSENMLPMGQLEEALKLKKKLIKR